MTRLLFLSILLVGCTEIPETKNVTFDKDIKPITSTVCIDCHRYWRNYSDYKTAFENRSDIFERVWINRSMPRNKPFSDKDRALFRDWVNQGGKK